MSQLYYHEQEEDNTFVERVSRHRGIRVSERNGVDGMRYVELGSQCGIELVDVAAITYDTFSVCDVEVARHLIHQHLPTDRTPFVGA